MALSNYSDLQTSIAAWIKRSDLTAVIPDFIRLCEARINREYTGRDLEVEAVIAGTIGSNTIALPADYSVPVALYNTTYTPRQEITQLLPRQLPITPISKRPDYWAVEGNYIAFDGLLDVAYNFAFRYNRRFSLSSTATINELLTAHPDVYLFGSLVEAAIYIFDEQRAAIWEQKYQAALMAASLQESTSYEFSSLRANDLVNNKRFNINSG